jgi:hypothetical protein
MDSGSPLSSLLAFLAFECLFESRCTAINFLSLFVFCWHASVLICHRFVIGAWDLGSSGISGSSDGAASRKSAGGSAPPQQGTPAVKPAAAGSSLAAPAKSVRISQAGSAPMPASAAGKPSEGASNAPQPILKKKEVGPVAVGSFLSSLSLCLSVSLSLCLSPTPLSLSISLPVPRGPYLFLRIRCSPFN